MSYIKEIISIVASFFSSDQNYFITTPYLSKVDRFKLQLKLNQVPVIYRYESCRDIAINDDFRKWNLSDLKCNNEFEKFALTIIPLQLPAVYLEGYKKISEQIKSSRLPKKPKLIWTSNSFYMDDRFKFWAAERVEEEVPLVIGQHGGVYGQGKFNFSEYHELKICDYYLSWGWERNDSNVIPIGLFKNTAKRKSQNLSHNKMLFMISGTSRYGGGIASMPIASQWIQYMDDQIEFYGDLPSQISDHVIVRLYLHDYGWSQYDRWKDVFPESNVDEGKLNYNELLVNSRIVVSGWNSGTFLESMALNIPTVIFWTPEYFEIREEARELFDKLKEVGIYHDSPFSASTHIKKIWDEVDLWWNRADVVSARNEFTEKYASSSNVVNKLNSVLRKISDQGKSVL